MGHLVVFTAFRGARRCDGTHLLVLAATACTPVIVGKAKRKGEHAGCWSRESMCVCE